MTCDCHLRCKQPKHAPGCDTKLGGLAYGIGISCRIAQEAEMTCEQLVEFLRFAWRTVEMRR